MLFLNIAIPANYGGNMSADILLDTNSIELVGDVTIKDALRLENCVEIDDDELVVSRPSSSSRAMTVKLGTTQRLRIDADGDITVYHTNGSTRAVVVSKIGLAVYNTSGSLKANVANNGTVVFYGDLTMSNNADIKLDGQWLAARLDAIEAQL
jgi:hypothetical protein